MSAIEKPVRASSVIVTVPALTEIKPAHDPTGTDLERVPNRKVK